MRGRAKAAAISRQYAMAGLLGALSVIGASEVIRSLLPVCDEVSSAALNDLQHQRDLLERQIAGEIRRSKLELEHLAAGANRLEHEISNFDSQSEVQRARILILEKLVATGASLRTKGLVSEFELRAREETLLEQNQALISIVHIIGSKRGELEEIHNNTEMAKLTSEARLEAVRNELWKTGQQLAKLKICAPAVSTPAGRE